MAPSQPQSGHFRGAGGTVWEMDLPLRELYGQQLAKGELVRVNADGSPWTGGTTPVQGGEEVAVDPRDLEIARLRAALEEMQAPVVPVDDQPKRPADNALKPEWVAYALKVDSKLTEADAEAMTKADLIELYGSK
jgi:hypothetical protein